MTGQKGQKPSEHDAKQGDFNKGKMAVTNPAREHLTENASTWLDTTAPAKGDPKPAS